MCGFVKVSVHSLYSRLLRKVHVITVQHLGTAKGLWQLFGVSEKSKRQGEKNIVLHSFIYCIYADVLCTILSSIKES